jgi:hypothetical protein
MRKEDVALFFGIISFILVAFILIVILGYNEIISFVVAALAGIIINQIAAKVVE